MCPIPKIILTLEFEQTTGITLELTNFFEVREVLPDPIEPLIFPSEPNLAGIHWGSCKITTAKGSVSSFIVYMQNFVTNTSASQATNGILDNYWLVQYSFFFFVDNQNALELLSELGIPTQLVDINYLDKTIDESTKHMMVTISDAQDNLLLNLTFLYDSEPSYNYSAREEIKYELKAGWIFGEEGNFNAIRIYSSKRGDTYIYNFTDGVIETSPFLSIQQVLGDTYVIPPQGTNEVKYLHITYEAKEQFTNP
jgi:hypothetical protein